MDEPTPGAIVGEIRVFAFGRSDMLAALGAAGWAECAGQSYDRQRFSKLHQALNNAWGSADGVNVYYLPDLRGMVLRGWHHGKQVIDHPRTKESPYWGDPDAASRLSPRPEAADTGNAGSAGDSVGSFQEDKFKRHAHDLLMDKEGTANPGKRPSTGGDGQYHMARTEDFGEPDETRASNAAVLYAIYVGQRVQSRSQGHSLWIEPMD